MATTSWTSVAIGGAATSVQPLPDEEIVGVRRDGTSVPPVADACKRILRVLVADDYRDAADSLATLVQLWGHDVRVAYSGVAALKLAVAVRPDVLLVDVAMPGLDGYELARQLRRHAALADSLLVAITGYADAAHRRLGLAAGFHAYLAKPVEPSTLAGLLRREIDRRADEPTVAAPIPQAPGILVVDDEAGVRNVLGMVLQQQGFAVWLAADGLEALEQYGRHRNAIDMVLMDVRMPGPDGPQTLGALRQLNPKVRCCFMSAEPDRYTEPGLRELGAVRVFTKPFPLTTLPGHLNCCRKM